MTIHHKAPGRISPIAPFLVYLSLLVGYLAVSPFNVADKIGPWLDCDYGMLTNTAILLVKGKSLYKEVWSLYSPAATYLVALLFRAFGDNLLTLRIALAFVAAATSTLVFCIARSVAPTSYAVVAAALTMLLGPLWVNFPYPSWFCIPLGLLMALLEHEGWKRKSLGFYFLAGALAGVIFSFKVNWGALAVAALLCTQVFEGALNSQTRKCSISGKVALVPVAFILLSIPASSVFLLRNQLNAAAVILFVLPAVAVSALGAAIFFKRRAPTISLEILPMIVLLTGFAVVVAPWLVYFALALGWEGFSEALIRPLIIFSEQIELPLPKLTPASGLLFVFSVFQGWAFFRKQISARIRWFFLLCLWAFAFLFLYQMIQIVAENFMDAGNSLCNKRGYGILSYGAPAVHIGVTSILARDLLRSKCDDREYHLVMALLIYSVSSFHTFYPIMEITHLIWSMVPLVPLAAFWIHRMSAHWEANSNMFPNIHKVVAKSLAIIPAPVLFGITLGLPIFNLFVTVDASCRLSLNKFQYIAAPRAQILMPHQKAVAINNVVNFIASKTASDEYIFDGTGSFYYFLTDRPNPVRFGHFVTAFLTQQDMADIIRSLDAAHPRIAIISYSSDLHFRMNWPYLHQYLQMNYTTAHTFGDYRILLARE